MLSIHLEVQQFVHKNETNYKMDEIKKENMNKFGIFIAEKSWKIQNIKYDKQTLCKFFETRMRRVK